ncbi:MAG: DUF6067 family protein [Verrucomicrobia bacterium]|nr:DUF6067 family protein [Verrucomicrobiota bacterium]
MQPGEFYVFQLGVYAAERDLELITLRVGDCTSAGAPSQSIPAAAFRCFNLGGTDFRGNPLVKEVRVAKGRVQPLWIGVQIPRMASGRFLGQIQLTAPGIRPVDVKVSITVAGEMLDDGW